MEYKGNSDMDFTENAWESLYDAVDDTQFYDRDAQLIYDSLRHRLKMISFGDYLRRYIYQKAGLEQPFSEIPIKEFQQIIQGSFSDNHTPASFAATTSKLSALAKNWLTQQTVKRNVVFLLGFGLNMSVEDVNEFLTKALREQQINPKNPFEVICWYCYNQRFSFLKFEKLWQAYLDIQPNHLDIRLMDSDRTISKRDYMISIHDDAALISYLAKLKANGKMSAMSLTIRESFNELYDEARKMIAQMYNATEDEEHENAVREYIRKISFNEHLFESEKQERIARFRAQKKLYTQNDITEADIEHVICAAIPTDKHGNLTPAKKSKLNDQFAGKRFSRQHISEILAGNAEISRFDLITLNFFIYSQKLDLYPDPKKRYIQFYDATNEILEKCFLGKIYIQNPYECFVLMCILSDDPMCTYADVWELSYSQ